MIGLLRRHGASLSCQTRDPNSNNLLRNQYNRATSITALDSVNPGAGHDSIITVDILDNIAKDPNTEIAIINALDLTRTPALHLLQLMIKHENLDGFKTFLKDNRQFFDDIELRFELLKQAIFHRKMKFIEFLLHDNPNLKASDEKSQKDKHYEPILSFLIKRDLCATSSTDEQEYGLAVRLIQLGAITNAEVKMEPSDGPIPLLHLFARHGSNKLFELFDPSKTNFNVVCNKARTVLDYAFMGGNPAIVRKALNAGVAPSKTIYITSYKRNSDAKQETELELLILALPAKLTELKFALVNENGLIQQEHNASGHFWHLNRSINHSPFLVQAYLESGVLPPQDWIDHLLSELNDYETTNEIKIKYLHLLALCVDFGLTFNPKQLKQIERYNDPSYGNDIPIKWLLEPLVTQSTANQANQNIQHAIDKLKSYKYVQPQALLFHRLSMLMQKIGRYDDAFDYLQKALAANNNITSFMIDSNDYVSLLHSWYNALEAGTPNVTISQKYQQLLDTIIALPCESLNSLSHNKMIDIYLTGSGISLHQRYDLVKKHLPYAGYHKDIAHLETVCKNMYTPENMFKYGLDTIITHTKYNSAEKTEKLKTTLRNASPRLQKVGAEFILGHETAKDEKLFAAIKAVRKTSVIELMQKVDTLLADNKFSDALNELHEAKTKPLYSILKSDKPGKDKTKAIQKFESKIEEITKLKISPSPR